MIWFRPLSGLVLALLMAVTSVTMAVARGQDRMGDTIEICAGFGTKLLTLDVRGRPATPHHPCPDCLMGVSALHLPGLAAALQPPQAMARATFGTPVLSATSLPPPPASARGPPSLI